MQQDTFIKYVCEREKKIRHLEFAVKVLYLSLSLLPVGNIGCLCPRATLFAVRFSLLHFCVTKGNAYNHLRPITDFSDIANFPN